MSSRAGHGPSSEQYVEVGIRELKSARQYLRLAGAKRAVLAVNRALKSAEGALRHARLRWDRFHRVAP